MKDLELHQNNEIQISWVCISIVWLLLRPQEPNTSMKNACNNIFISNHGEHCPQYPRNNILEHFGLFLSSDSMSICGHGNYFCFSLEVGLCYMNIYWSSIYVCIYWLSIFLHLFIYVSIDDLRMYVSLISLWGCYDEWICLMSPE